MSTRPIVEDAIAAIEDNGNNTAIEVRDVLTKLLDYTENDSTSPPTSDLRLFHFFNEGEKVNAENAQGNVVGDVWYSFKGIQNGTVNFTFRLITNAESVFTYFFDVPDELFKILTEILQGTSPNRLLTFSIPIYRRNDMSETEIGILGIDLSSLNKVGLEIKSNLERTNAIDIFTSIQFHAPEFHI